MYNLIERLVRTTTLDVYYVFFRRFITGDSFSGDLDNRKQSLTFPDIFRYTDYFHSGKRVVRDLLSLKIDSQGSWDADFLIDP